MDGEQKVMVSNLYKVLICTVYVLLAVTGATFIKLGATASKGLEIPFLGMISLKTVFGVFLYGMGFVVFTCFVSRLKVSLAIPIVSGAYAALIVIIGVYIFKEKLAFGQIVGIVMIILGTVCTALFKK